MKWNHLPAGDLNSFDQRLKTGLGEYAGLVVQKSKQDDGYAQRLATQIIEATIAPHLTTERAKAIMGDRMFGVDDAEKHIFHTMTEAQRDALLVVPYTEETLRLHKDHSVLVAVPDLSLADLMSLVRMSRTLLPHVYVNQTSTKIPEPLLRSHNGAGWFLIMEAEYFRLDTFFGQPLSRQHAPSKYSRVYANAIVYATIVWRMETGRFLNSPELQLRCYDGHDGRHVAIDGGGAAGLRLSYLDDRIADPKVGLALARTHD